MWCYSICENACSAYGKSLVFERDKDSIITNPERGFYGHSETMKNGASFSKLSSSFLEGQYRKGHSLILRLYYFDSFRKKSLSSSLLSSIAEDFDTLRSSGMKAVLRFAYVGEARGSGWPPKIPYYDAQSLSRVLDHLDQLKPIFQQHADVIAVVQAGFVGIWGEWYFTDEFGPPGDPSRKSMEDV